MTGGAWIIFCIVMHPCTSNSNCLHMMDTPTPAPPLSSPLLFSRMRVPRLTSTCCCLVRGRWRQARSWAVDHGGAPLVPQGPGALRQVVEEDLRDCPHPHRRADPHPRAEVPDQARQGAPRGAGCGHGAHGRQGRQQRPTAQQDTTRPTRPHGEPTSHSHTSQAEHGRWTRRQSLRRSASATCQARPT